MTRIALILLAALAALGAGTARAQLFGGQALLEPEKAFRISARALDERTVEVEFRIASGYYMYRDRFAFATQAGRPLGEVEIPRGKVKEDPFFGKTETFREVVRIRVPMPAEDAVKEGMQLKVTSQGCSDKGVCYTPLEQLVRVDFATAGFDASQSGSPAVQVRIPWLIIVASLAAGLALGWASAGAPLPADAVPRGSPLSVSLWSLGLAAAGGAAGWLGSQVGRADHPWLAAPLAVVFVAMAALWMHWSTRGAPSKPGTRSLALVAAVLLLLFHASDAGIGAAAALGAGVAGARFRGAGVGMRHQPAFQWVALAMLAAAVWVATALLPELFAMFAWGAWLVLAGTLLRAFDPLPEGASWVMRVGKAAGLALLVWGVAVLVGAMSGARNPLQPLDVLRGASVSRTVDSPVRWARITTLPELQARIASAGRPVMVDLYADWCISCKEMEQFTFSDPGVRARMERMLLLQADVTRNTEDDKAILKRLRLFGPPGIVFFDAQGAEMRERVIGFQPPERFVRVLDAVLSKTSQ